MGFIRENFGTRNMHTLLICEYYVEYIEATHDMKLIGSDDFYWYIHQYFNIKFHRSTNFQLCSKTRIWEAKIQLICALMMFKLWSLECSHVGKNILGSSSSSKTTCKMTMYFFLINDKKNSQNINWSFCRKSKYHKNWYQTWSIKFQFKSYLSNEMFCIHVLRNFI